MPHTCGIRLQAAPAALHVSESWEGQTNYSRHVLHVTPGELASCASETLAAARQPADRPDDQVVLPGNLDPDPRGGRSGGRKLSSAEKNPDTVELPRGAQSTYVAEAVGRFPDGDVSQGIVVYVNSTGITAADRAKAQADRRVFARYAVEPVGPVIPSADGKALEVTIGLSSNSSSLTTDARQVRDQAQRALPPGLTAQLTRPGRQRP